MAPGRKVVIAGGSGFIGSALVEALDARDWEVVVLTRSPEQYVGVARAVGWDGRSVGRWGAELDRAEALVNLAGRSINGRPTQRHREGVLTSRVDSVRVIGEALKKCERPPQTWVQASALGIYGDTGDRICDEDAAFASGYPANVCRAWEDALAKAALKGMRVPILRIGFVLGRSGGALPVLAKLTRWGLGGTAGSGRQWVSWIHIEDLVAIFLLAIEGESISGAYNAAGPNPVRNRDLMRAIRRALGCIWSPPAPAFAVRLGCWVLGSDANLALTSQRCMPGRMTATGFGFKFANLDEAASSLLARGPNGEE